jgi:hypothetical protein
LQALSQDFHAEFLHQFPADSLRAGFAKLDPATEWTIKAFILDRIVSPIHKDAVMMAKYTNG